MTNNERDLRTFMAVAHEVAIAEAQEMQTTPAIRRRARAMARFAHDHLAAIRREERANRSAKIVSGDVRPSIVAMARDAVIARLSELWTRYPEMQVAHRDCVGMSDDDLRSALEDAESMVARLV